MASQSDSVQQWKYDTFLNFRKDTSNSNAFVSRLRQRLEDTGINLFKYDDSEQKTGEIIEESRTAIIIFSENYALNHRCLEELAKIMECVQHKGQIPIPVYCYVEQSYALWVLLGRPTQVLVDDTFKGFSVQTVQSWKESIRKAYNIPGFKLHLTKSSLVKEEEEKCIQEIVDKIWQVRSIAKYPVGIECRVKEIKSLLRIGSGGVYFVGVCGISGVGKTTVARAIFDDISCLFEGSCFLANVREVSEKHGLSHLKQKLLSQISKQDFLDV